MNVKSYWRSTTIGRSAKVLSRRDQKKVLAVIFIQITLGLLDLLGVAVIGILGALAVSGVQSKQPGNRVNSALQMLHLSDQPFQVQAAILGIVATVLLISRTLFSIFFTRRILFFLSRKGALISASLISHLLSESLVAIQKRTTQETLYSVTSGVNSITVGVLGTTVSLISDGSLLLVMTIGLFLVDPTIALSTFIVFAFIGFLLYRLLHNKARTLGQRDAKINIQSNEKIIEVLNSYRESVVRNRRNFYAQEIGKLRLALANTQAELAFMPNVSKYVVETTVVIGALLISGIQFFMQDASHAVATLSVFLAAGTRIAPAVLRVQQGAISIKGSLGTSSPTLDLIESLADAKVLTEEVDELDVEHVGFIPKIELKSATFTYPNRQNPAVNDVSLVVEPGTTVAFVGPSGAGKTTIIDVLLGILNLDKGNVLISDLPPLDAFAKWPGAVSYVPQDVTISNGTVRQNVGLGFPESEVTDILVRSALHLAQLEDFIKTLTIGFDTPVGERGARISGGQRQRLGIARAMFTSPKLLVLDEATSSLDAQTEVDISNAINALKGKVTILMVAHRLSTVRNADQVVYLENGKLLAKGTFEEVRTSIPDFDKQAKLMGF